MTGQHLRSISELGRDGCSTRPVLAGGHGIGRVLRLHLQREGSKDERYHGDTPQKGASNVAATLRRALPLGFP